MDRRRTTSVYLTDFQSTAITRPVARGPGGGGGWCIPLKEKVPEEGYKAWKAIHYCWRALPQTIPGYDENAFPIFELIPSRFVNHSIKKRSVSTFSKYISELHSSSK